MQSPTGDPSRHRFESQPHRTLLALTAPVMLSLVAEPLTGVVDTAFVARLGSAPAAALGVGTALLSSMFWVFNFLGISTQTELARAAGAGDREAAREIAGAALALALGVGLALALLLWVPAGWLAEAMGATGEVRAGAARYLQLRLLGGPAVLASMAAFGALRGVQDMRTPLRVALIVNALNMLLDPLLIFGVGPLPALGLAGAAAATAASQWLGALLAVGVLRRHIGLPRRPSLAGAGRLLGTAGNLALRTALLILFMLAATRAATRGGPEVGAAHQGIRQVWIFTAFALDSFALSAQSLVGYFLGAARTDLARRVARVSCGWGLATGTLLGAAMLAGERAVALLLVPKEAQQLFASAWWVASLAMPLNALAFVTDGIHWGSGDYRFLRNAMLVATGLGAAALVLVDPGAPGALVGIWWVSLGWIAVRSGFGVARIWPGLGQAPLRGGGSRSGTR